MRSACLPAAREPMRSPRPTAAAPLSVRAVTTSPGNMPMRVQAMAPTSGRFSVRQVPGLQSVARATGTPRSISRRAGAKSTPRKKAVPGSSVATVPDAARASMPASLTQSR